MVPKHYHRSFVQSLREYDAESTWNYVFSFIQYNSEQDVERYQKHFDISRCEMNSFRNRYVNVSPYDENIVKITPTRENRDGYINASPVVIDEAKRNYILCQGPLEETSYDFWQMIWEQNVPLIVMLNKLIEGGKWKCHNYFPSKETDIDEQTYGNFNIKLIEEVDNGAFLYRKLELTNKSSNENRQVHHIQYTEWPDFGVPPSSRCFLYMLKFIKDLKVLSESVTDPPTVVHCSAGIGRSGSFIFVDSILRMVEMGVPWDSSIPEFVINMRRQRFGLIQTPTQLRFACTAIIDGLEASYNLSSNDVEDKPIEYETTPPKADEIPVEEAPQPPAIVETVPPSISAPKEDDDKKQKTKDDQRGTKRGSSSGSDEIPADIIKEQQAETTKTKRREMIARMLEKSRAANSRWASFYNLDPSLKMTCSVSIVVAAVVAAYYFSSRN